MKVRCLRFKIFTSSVYLKETIISFKISNFSFLISEVCFPSVLLDVFNKMETYPHVCQFVMCIISYEGIDTTYSPCQDDGVQVFNTKPRTGDNLGFHLCCCSWLCVLDVITKAFKCCLFYRVAKRTFQVSVCSGNSFEHVFLQSG